MPLEREKKDDFNKCIESKIEEAIKWWEDRIEDLINKAAAPAFEPYAET
jgi:hypothetical protein